MIPPTLALPCTPPSVALALLAVTPSGTLKSVNGRERPFSCWVSRCRLSIQTVADGCKNSNSDFYKNDRSRDSCLLGVRDLTRRTCYERSTNLAHPGCHYHTGAVTAGDERRRNLWRGLRWDRRLPQSLAAARLVGRRRARGLGAERRSTVVLRTLRPPLPWARRHEFRAFRDARLGP